MDFPENPQQWTLDTCSEKLMESEKAEDIKDHIFYLRNAVFDTLKKMGHFAEDVEIKDAQVYVGMVMGMLTKMSQEKHQQWTVDTGAEKLMESEAADEINDLIWDLRGIVFFKLKKMGHFAEDVEGPDAQVCVDMVIGRLMGAL